jgi:ferredoxin
MIISQNKPRQELLNILRDAKKLILIGCGECATACKTGDQESIEELKVFLEENGKEVLATMVSSISCNKMLVKKELKSIKEAVGQADGIVSMSCGDGVQTIAGVVSIPVYPSTDTMFLGEAERVGLFTEACRFCGKCVLGDTGAICPITKCAKSLTNGPCGGAKDGQCEVNSDNPCAWIKIYTRLKELGQLDRLNNLNTKDYGAYQYPRTINLREGHKDE